MNVTAEQKACIHVECILSVLTYAAEIWVFTKGINIMQDHRSDTEGPKNI